MAISKRQDSNRAGRRITAIVKNPFAFSFVISAAPIPVYGQSLKRRASRTSTMSLNAVNINDVVLSYVISALANSSEADVMKAHRRINEERARLTSSPNSSLASDPGMAKRMRRQIQTCYKSCCIDGVLDFYDDSAARFK
jgi:hypothetical protein